MVWGDFGLVVHTGRLSLPLTGVLGARFGFGILMSDLTN